MQRPAREPHIRAWARYLNHAPLSEFLQTSDFNSPMGKLSNNDCLQISRGGGYMVSIPGPCSILLINCNFINSTHPYDLLNQQRKSRTLYEL